MKYQKYILFLAVILSCGQKRELSKLIERGSLYYYENSNKPFTGKVYSKQKNLSNDTFISASYTFKNGVPDGKWKTFGYSREIIQEGIFQPVFETSNLKLGFISLSRINVCRYSEGKFPLIDIYIISKTPNLDSGKFVQKKQSLITWLIKNGYLKETEIKNINSCEMFSGEF
jgi:hypothetical protein